MSEGELISFRVVEEVADQEGIDPTELRPPLHTVIDTDALDTLFQSTPSATRAHGTVTFQYKEYMIQIDDSGEIEIGETVSFTEQTEPQMQSTEDKVSG